MGTGEVRRRHQAEARRPDQGDGRQVLRRATRPRIEVTCEIDRDKEAPAKISFAFAPKVTFEGGKATKASLNWGTIDAPALVKGAMWTATATDNTFNVLQSTLVEDINQFIADKCLEVKDEWK